MRVAGGCLERQRVLHSDASARGVLGSAYVLRYPTSLPRLASCPYSFLRVCFSRGQWLRCLPPGWAFLPGLAFVLALAGLWWWGQPLDLSDSVECLMRTFTFVLSSCFALCSGGLTAGCHRHPRLRGYLWSRDCVQVELRDSLKVVELRSAAPECLRHLHLLWGGYLHHVARSFRDISTHWGRRPPACGYVRVRCRYLLVPWWCTF